MPTPSPFADASTAPPVASGSTMDTLYRAALGPVQLPRYLALFERFDHTGRAPAGWNLAASLATLNWMLLHHLWTAALIYVALVEGLALLIFGVGRPLLHWPEQVEWGLIAAFALFAIALPGLFGDALLHSAIRKRIAHALVAAHTIPETCALLARQASSWRRLTWIAAANMLLFSALALAWVLVPPDGWSSTTASTPIATGAVQTAPPLLAPASRPAVEPAPSLASAASTASQESTPAPMLSPPEPVPAPPSTVPDVAAASEPAPAASAAQTPTPTPTSTAQPASTPAPSTIEAPSAKAPAPPAAAPVPRKPAKQVAAKPVPAAPEPDAAPATAKAAPASAASTEVAAGSPASEAAAPASQAAAPASQAAGSRPAAPVGSARGYYLNVGFFADEANARRTQAKLLNGNLPAFRQTITTPNGERTRVRVGPFETEAEAQKAAAQIRSSLKLDTLMYRQGG